MDVDNSAAGSQNPNNHDDPITLSRDFAADLGHVKSYVCAFCKRGFSNAQALGGHMNIHRRDRARLRISEFDSDDTKDENLLSLDIKSTDHTTSSQVSKDRGTDGNKILSLKENLESLLEKVPHDHQCSSDYNEGISSEPSLDLELRLGHDAYDAKTKK